MAELRKKLHTAEFERSKLENYLTELREQVELDTDTRDSQMTALQNTVKESRDRERRLEDQRHNLEIELNYKNQKLQELVIKLQESDSKLKDLNETVVKLWAATRNYASSF